MQTLQFSSCLVIRCHERLLLTANAVGDVGMTLVACAVRQIKRLVSVSTACDCLCSSSASRRCLLSAEKSPLHSQTQTSKQPRAVQIGRDAFPIRFFSLYRPTLKWVSNVRPYVRIRKYVCPQKVPSISMKFGT